MAEIIATCISEQKGTRKHEVPSIMLKTDHGIVGDAHAGNWHRQVSLLADESVDQMRAKGLVLNPGDFAENILTRGIELSTLPIGTQLRAGTAILKVTQIGKECHADCEIRRKTGMCVMPTQGIFAQVEQDGIISPGDKIEVII